jgi:hypothetical protein
MTKKRLILVALVFAVAVATSIALLRGRNAIFLETPTARYRVISAQFESGTNLVFAQDEPIKAWYRGMRWKMRKPLQGFQGPFSFRDGINRHAAAVLCEGKLNYSRPIGQDVKVDCINSDGRMVRFNGIMTVERNDGRFWIILAYTDAEIVNLHRMGLADAEVTNFAPRQIRFIRKSDDSALIQLDLSH